MAEIKDYSQEEKELFQIMDNIRDSAEVHEEVLMTITVLINTTEKLQKFKEWIENKTENGVLNTTEAEITNVVSRIGKRKNPEITEQELSEFLKGLGIKAEGIQAILKTYPMGIQRARFKILVEERVERDEQSPKEAVWQVWRWLHQPQIVHFRPVGPEPKESDFLLL